VLAIGPPSSNFSPWFKPPVIPLVTILQINNYMKYTNSETESSLPTQQTTVTKSDQSIQWIYCQGSHAFLKIIFHTFLILSYKNSIPCLIFIFQNSWSWHTISHIAQHCVNIMNCFSFSKTVLTCKEQDLKNQCLKTYCINLNQLCPNPRPAWFPSPSQRFCAAQFRFLL